MGVHFCSTMWALLGRRNAVDNVIHLLVFANVVAIALYAVGTCVAAFKAKLDTFDENALLAAAHLGARALHRRTLDALLFLDMLNGAG